MGIHKYFSKQQKDLALHTSKQELQQRYKTSEYQLKCLSFSGDRKGFEKCMKEHQLLECALLYQNTKHFQKKLDKVKKVGK